jgi:integrase
MIRHILTAGVKSLLMATKRTKSASGPLSRGSFPTSLVDSVLVAAVSPHTRRSYAKGIAEFITFAGGRAITPALVYEWRIAMLPVLAPSTINVRLSAVRKIFEAGSRSGQIPDAEANRLLEVGGVPFRGTRIGNWLTIEQTRRLLSVPNRKNRRGLRNYLILAVLVGCALRVNDLATVDIEQVQQRDGRWVFADIVGKGGRVRSVPIPSWVKQAIDGWLRETKMKSGRLVRQLTLKPEGLSTQGIWDIVSKAAQKIGVKHFGPHDLRRTCARLCKEQGGDIEQIQYLLGHASVLTTQRYLGTVHNLKHAVNDNLGL